MFQLKKKIAEIFQKLNCKVFIPISELGSVMHICEDDLVCKANNEKIPYFNAPVFLENKQQVGKVDEIMGPITEYVSFSHLF